MYDKQKKIKSTQCSHEGYTVCEKEDGKWRCQGETHPLGRFLLGFGLFLHSPREDFAGYETRDETNAERGKRLER